MANRLTAQLVVDLTDRTGGKTQAIIGNLDRLKRAERDYMLADKGLRLSNRDRALEKLMTTREQSLQERRDAHNMWLSRGTVAAVAVGVAAAKSYADFADLERRVNRIVINADKGAGAIKPTIAQLQGVAGQTKMAFGDIVEGFETLIASGRSLEEGLAFLPSIAVTAQASGAGMQDIALSADAIAGSMKIAAPDMQKAFDILVAGGKAGKFELKDMARFLPSLLPAFAALGYEGTEGLSKITSMLQAVRNQTGTAGEAATNLASVFSNMTSEETSNKFKKMGIDIRKDLDRARASGKDVLDVFLDIANKATKGDISKLNQLFTNDEMQRGVRALITQRQEFEKLNDELKNVDGATLKDFNQIVADSQAKVTELSNLWSKFAEQVGSGVATVANPTLDYLTSTVDDFSARNRARAGMTPEQERAQKRDFDSRYKAQHPGAWWFQVNAAYMDAQQKVGRGQSRSVFDDLMLEEGRRAGGAIMARETSKGTYSDAGKAGLLPPEFPGGGHGYTPQKLPGGGEAPIPGSRPSADDRVARALGFGVGYRSRGAYEPEAIAAEARRRQEQLAAERGRMENERQQAEAARWAREGSGSPDAGGWEGFKRFLFGAAADPNFDPKKHFGIETKAAGESGPQEVLLSGTPTVTIANPPPRPNISITMPVTIQQAADPAAIAQQLGQAVQSQMNSLQASTNDSGL